MQLQNPGPAPIYDNESVPVSVFNALPPNVFTDLNLSAVVGTRAAWIELKFLNNTGGACVITCRRNGDADNPISGVQVSGTIATGSFAYLITDTDDNGVIEWKQSAVPAGTVQIWVMSWIGE